MLPTINPDFIDLRDAPEAALLIPHYTNQQQNPEGSINENDKNYQKNLIQWALWLGQGLIPTCISIGIGTLLILYGLHNKIYHAIKSSMISIAGSWLEQNISTFAEYICNFIHHHYPIIEPKNCIEKIIPEVQNFTSFVQADIKNISKSDLEPAVNKFSLNLLEIFILGAVTTFTFIAVTASCCYLFNKKRNHTNNQDNFDSTTNPERTYYMATRSIRA